jgi:hypothetical protein
VSSFSLVWSSENDDHHFTAIKDGTETFPLSFTPYITKAYNINFIMDKPLVALEHWHNLYPGPDSVHSTYDEILSHFAPASREFLLSICNYMWTESSVPAFWREATTVAVLKPDRGHSMAANYRLISLSSFLCKTTEHIVNHHFVWVLES